jgi:hypothetical protein
MEVSISIKEASIKLGQPVTIMYSASECVSVTLLIPNLPNPIEVGGDETVSGSIKVLPLTDGEFAVQIKGSGRYGFANDYVPELTKIASCVVL